MLRRPQALSTTGSRSCLFIKVSSLWMGAHCPRLQSTVTRSTTHWRGLASLATINLEHGFCSLDDMLYTGEGFTFTSTHEDPPHPPESESRSWFRVTPKPKPRKSTVHSALISAKCNQSKLLCNTKHTMNAEIAEPEPTHAVSSPAKDDSLGGQLSEIEAFLRQSHKLALRVILRISDLIKSRYDTDKVCLPQGEVVSSPGPQIQQTQASFQLQSIARPDRIKAILDHSSLRGCPCAALDKKSQT